MGSETPRIHIIETNFNYDQNVKYTYVCKKIIEYSRSMLNACTLLSHE